MILESFISALSGSTLVFAPNGAVCDFHWSVDRNPFHVVTNAPLKQVVTNRISQFFAVDSEKVEGKDPLVVRFQPERITYVGRTEPERKPFKFRVIFQHLERTHQNPYGLVVRVLSETDLAQACCSRKVRE